MGEVEKVEGALMRAAKALGIKKPAATAQIFMQWDQVVGPDLAKRCELASLVDGVMRIRVSSGSWATEIRYLGNKIAAAANAIAGSQVVVSVETFVGKMEERGGAPDAGGTGKQTNVCLPALPEPSAKDVEAAEELVKEVPDPDLRESLKKAHLAAKMRRRRG